MRKQTQHSNSQRALSLPHSQLSDHLLPLLPALCSPTLPVPSVWLRCPSLLDHEQQPQLAAMSSVYNVPLFDEIPLHILLIISDSLSRHFCERIAYGLPQLLLHPSLPECAKAELCARTAQSLAANPCGQSNGVLKLHCCQLPATL